VFGAIVILGASSITISSRTFLRTQNSGMSGAYPAFKSAQDSGNDQATSSASKHLKPESDIQKSKNIQAHINDKHKANAMASVRRLDMFA
jgi:hypothetical protein